jgi:hypothetical protein
MDVGRAGPQQYTRRWLQFGERTRHLNSSLQFPLFEVSRPEDTKKRRRVAIISQQDDIRKAASSLSSNPASRVCYDDSLWDYQVARIGVEASVGKDSDPHQLLTRRRSVIPARGCRATRRSGSVAELTRRNEVEPSKRVRELRIRHRSLRRAHYPIGIPDSLSLLKASGPTVFKRSGQVYFHARTKAFFAG